MKKKWLWITAIVLLFAFPLTACGNGGEVNESVENTVDNTVDNTIEEIVETLEVPKAGGDIGQIFSGKIDNLTEYTNAWNDLYSIHESTINAYTGMPIMSLAMVGLPLASSIFYSMLNPNNVDGDFSGNIWFAETEGFYNKSGDVAVFGQDWVRDADGAMSNEKIGDRVITDGLFDASKGYLKIEDSTMRADKTFSKITTEFIRSDDGSFVCLYQVSNDLDYDANENKINSLTFIAMGNDYYEFVTASGTVGVDGKVLTLTEGMTVQEATAEFEDAGFTIDETGGIQNGIFVVN